MNHVVFSPHLLVRSLIAGKQRVVSKEAVISAVVIVHCLVFSVFLFPTYHAEKATLIRFRKVVIQLKTF